MPRSGDDDLVLSIQGREGGMAMAGALAVAMAMAKTRSEEVGFIKSELES